MRAGRVKVQNQRAGCFFVKKQPIVRDVAFAKAAPVAVELMVAEFRVEGYVVGEIMDDRFQCVPLS